MKQLLRHPSLDRDLNPGTPARELEPAGPQRIEDSRASTCSSIGIHRKKSCAVP